MAKKQPSHKSAPARVPIHGKSEHNAAFLLAIGGLAVNWANNESVFMAMLQALMGGGEHSALIVWLSLRTTRARLELIRRLCREQVMDRDLLADIEAAIDQFKGFSRTRNFFCHATYRYDHGQRLIEATSAALTYDEQPLSFETKVMDRQTLNEITDASMKMATFNKRLWKLIPRLERALGVQRVRLPPFLSEE